MTVERIRPKAPSPVLTPQCCVEEKNFTSHKWCTDYIKRRKKKVEARGYKPNQCYQQSSFRIDGKYYCTKHAGVVALNILIKAGTRPEADDERG